MRADHNTLVRDQVPEIIADRKRAQRGGFQNKIFLEHVDGPA